MKKITLLLSFAPLFSFSQAKVPGTIKGVITYFFNEYQGDKPDLGAKVYAVDTSKCKGFDPNAAFLYDMATIKGHESGDTAFDSIDTRCFDNFVKLKNNQSTFSATVDAIGNYSLTVPPGTYYVLMQSKGRNSITLTEMMGKVYLINVTVLSGQTADESHNFGLK